MEKPIILEFGWIEYLPSSLVIATKCVLSSLIVGVVTMVLLYYAGMGNKIIPLLATLPSLPIVYFGLVQPALDKISRKRGEPLFCFRCKLFGHKYIMSPVPPYPVWCGRCGKLKEVWP